MADTEADFDGAAIVDRHRSADLDDVGGCGLTLAVIVDDTGAEHLGVVARRIFGNRRRFSPGSPSHEMAGPLPLHFLKRVAIAQRTRRCGRTTKSGRPCRITVAHPRRRLPRPRKTRSTKGIPLMPDFPVLDAPRAEANNDWHRVIFDSFGDIEPYIEETDSFIAMPLRLVHDDAAGWHLELGPYTLGTRRDIERLRTAIAALDLATGAKQPDTKS